MAIEIKVGATFDGKDITRAQRELDKLGRIARNQSETVVQRMERMGSSFQDLGKQMSMRVTAPLVAAGAVAVKFAADLEDSMGASEQIFGAASGSVQKWAKDLPTYFGIAEGAAMSHVNIMGSMLQNIGGLTEKEAAKQGQALLELAGDLTAMYGGTVEDAVRALTGALKGNNTMLDNYGMGVNDATIKAKALEMGLSKGTGEITLQAKQAATLALIWEQTSAAQGQASREAGTASGQMRTLKTEVTNLASDFGMLLLPMVSKIAEAFSGLARFLTDLPGPIKGVIVFMGTLAAAAGPAIWAVGTLLTNMAKIVAFNWAGTFSKGVDALRGFSSAVQGGMAQALAAVRTMSTASLLAFGGIGLAIAAAGAALVFFTSRQASDAEKRFKTLNSSVETLNRSFDYLAATGRISGPLKDLIPALRDMKTEAEGNVNVFAKLTTGVSDFLPTGNPVKKWFTSVDNNASKARETLTAFDGVLAATSETTMAVAIKQFEHLAEAARAEGFELTLEMMPQLKTAIEQAAEQAGVSVPEFLAMAGAGKDVESSIDGATRALTDWEAKVKAQFDPLWGFQDAVINVEKANLDLWAAQNKVNETVGEFGPDSGEARLAMQDLDKAQQNVILRSGEMNSKFADLINGVKNGTIPLSDAIATIDGLAASHQISADTADAQRQKFDDLARLVIGTEFPNVEIPIDSNAADVLERLIAIRDTLGQLGTKVASAVVPWGFNPNSAFGGPVKAGRAGWVGERGKELFVPSTDGVIIPHYESRRMMGAASAAPAGGGDTYNITINGLVGRDKQDVLDFLARELPRAAATQARSYG